MREDAAANFASQAGRAFPFSERRERERERWGEGKGKGGVRGPGTREEHV